MGIKVGDKVVLLVKLQGDGTMHTTRDMERWVDESTVLEVQEILPRRVLLSDGGAAWYALPENLAKVRKCSKKQFRKLRKGDVIRARGHSELPASHVDLTVVMVEPSSYEGSLPVYLKWGDADSVWPGEKRKATFYIKRRADA